MEDRYGVCSVLNCGFANILIMLHQNKEKYYSHALQQLPRLLSFLDRDPHSPNYGSFDRLYWAWKLKDFSDATLQRGIYPLWIFYSNDFKGNNFFKNEKILEWIKAGIVYYCRIQHRNGSCDQAFPWEQSYGAVAFTLYPLIAVYSKIKEEFNNEEKIYIEDALLKAAYFLYRNNEEHGLISNHLAGAAVSLKEADKLFNGENFSGRAREIVELIIKNQSSDGWFKEYTGADPGYQTLATYYLALYYRETRDSVLLKALKKSTNFLSYFIHTDGSFGGEYGSRNTEIFYPAGFEILKEKIPLADTIGDRMYEAVCTEKTVLLSAMDAGNLVPLMINYLVAYIESKKNIERFKCELPFEVKSQDMYFADSKILVSGNNNYYSIVNGLKGGVLKIYDKRKKQIVWDDEGYVGELKSGKYVTTQVYNPAARTSKEGDSFEIETNFFELIRNSPGPLKFFILRGLNMTVFKSLFLGNLIKKMLVKMLISKKKKYPVILKRVIEYYQDRIEINDTITKSKKKMIFKWLSFGRKFAAIHMATARYFQNNQLLNTIGPCKIDLNEFNQKNKIQIKTIIRNE